MKSVSSSRNMPPPFDPEVFLEQAGVGRTRIDLKKNQVLLSQGDPADDVYSVQFGKEGRPENVIPKISQEVLAEMIGTTRSRVNFFMNRFRKLGFIEYNGKLEVHSSLLNVILHD